MSQSRSKGKILIDQNRCKGCGLCIAACPKKHIRMANQEDFRGIRVACFEGGHDCTGCGFCPPDCPYRALEMIDTPDRRYLRVAVVDPTLCVSCGVCIGSCPELALTLGDEPAGAIWSEILAAASKTGPVEIVFTCERHAYHGARPYLDEPYSLGDRQVVITPVTCVGMIHPRLAQEALDAGAAGVRVIGCPPEDCTNREGNLWLSERIERKRRPRLRRAYADAPISTSWLPPNDFARAFDDDTPVSEATTYGFALSKRAWRRYVPGIAVLAAALALMVWVSDLPFASYPGD